MIKNRETVPEEIEIASVDKKSFLGEKRQSSPHLKAVYDIPEVELKRIEIEKFTYLRVLEISGTTFIDIRKYFRGYPTKKGIRITYDSFKKIYNLI